MGAYDELLKSITLEADASLAGYTGVSGTPGAASPNSGNGQFRFCKITAAHTVGRVAGPTEAAVGVVQNKPQHTGDAATVAIFGVSLVIAGAAILAAAPITSDASGRAVTAVGVTGAVQYGTALEAAAGAGHLVPVLLKV